MTAILATTTHEIENEIEYRIRRICSQDNKEVARYLKIDLVYDQIRLLDTLFQNLPDISDLLQESEIVSKQSTYIADKIDDISGEWGKLVEDIEYLLFKDSGEVNEPPCIL